MTIKMIQTNKLERTININIRTIKRLTILCLQTAPFVRANFIDVRVWSSRLQRLVARREPDDFEQNIASMFTEGENLKSNIDYCLVIGLKEVHFV
jgi:hypothetical protein